MNTAQPLVLAVDDEVGILRLLKSELEAQGFRVITSRAGDEGLRLAEEQRPDVVLLDLLMPEMSGLEFMRQLKERSNTPVILVTAKDSDGDRVRGLDLGADDYIGKPFSLEEVAARIRTVLRRSVGFQNTQRVVRAGGIEIDLSKRIAFRDGEMVPLTRTEWHLLEVMAANPGKVLLNAELLSKVWGPEYRSDLQYLRVWVSRLRHKLEADPPNPTIVKTMPGIGYYLDAQAMPAA